MENTEKQNQQATEPSSATFKVLFDNDCFFCRQVAAFAARHVKESIAFEPWQDFKNTPDANKILAPEILNQPADKLRVLGPNGTLFEDDKAWEWLLQNHPDLKTIGWIAEKLGIAKQTATVISKTTRTARRICPTCGRR